MLYAGDEGEHGVEPGLSPGIEDGSSSFVDSDVSFVNNVEGSCGVENEDDDN